LERVSDSPLVPASFACELRFNVVQVDPATGEEEGDAFEEEYPTEVLVISTSDFMAKVSVPDFRKAWEDAGNDNEVLEKFALNYKKVEEAVVAILDMLGMQPMDGTAVVKPDMGTKPHMLHLSGTFVSGEKVLARAQVSSAGPAGGVVLKVAVRSGDADVSRMVADCIN
jgi:coatomer protein complex subunit gamma